MVFRVHILLDSSDAHGAWKLCLCSFPGTLPIFSAWTLLFLYLSILYPLCSISALLFCTSPLMSASWNLPWDLFFLFSLYHLPQSKSLTHCFTFTCSSTTLLIQHVLIDCLLEGPNGKKVIRHRVCPQGTQGLLGDRMYQRRLLEEWKVHGYSCAQLWNHLRDGWGQV